MKPRYWGHLAIIALVLASVALSPHPVEACEPYPGDAWAPPGYAGCELAGPTVGIASVWPGHVAATNGCTWPWEGCTPLRVQSHKTGLVIEVTPAMYCQCWWGVTGPSGETQRLVDLTVGQVQALGLEVGEGLFEVTATPIRSAVLPDTSMLEAFDYNEWCRYELPTVESQAVRLGCSYHPDRAVLHVRGMSS